MSDDLNIEPGESLHLKTTSDYISPHCHALYLGPDNSGNIKVLLPTFSSGFEIVNLSKIDRKALRPSGKFNLREARPGYFKYVFWDSFEEIIVEAEMVDGIWTLKPEDIPEPSWQV